MASASKIIFTGTVIYVHSDLIGTQPCAFFLPYRRMRSVWMCRAGEMSITSSQKVCQLLERILVVFLSMWNFSSICRHFQLIISNVSKGFFTGWFCRCLIEQFKNTNMASVFWNSSYLLRVSRISDWRDLDCSNLIFQNLWITRISENSFFSIQNRHLHLRPPISQLILLRPRKSQLSCFSLVTSHDIWLKFHLTRKF